MTVTVVDRACFATLVPETNVTLAADLARMALPGVTIRYGQLAMGSGQMADDAQHQHMLDTARGSIEGAVAALLPYTPTALIMGLSIETFQGGRDGSRAFSAYLRQLTGGLPVASGAEACVRALTPLGATRIGIVTPYQSAADDDVRRFFAESGFDVAALGSLRASHATATATVTPDQIQTVIRQVARHNVEAVVQCGTNLSMLDLVEPLESELGRPILSMNATTYWHALRLCQIPDQLNGFGMLLREF